MSAARPIGIHTPRPKNDSRIAPRAAVMAPTPTPSAATTPMSNLGFGAGAAPAAVLPAVVAAVESMSPAAASAAPARLATCSSMKRMTRLYGDQNAWPMLIGFSMIFVIFKGTTFPLGVGGGWAAATGFAAASSLILLFYALTKGPAGQVVPASSAYPIVTLAGSALFLGERILTGCRTAAHPEPAAPAAPELGNAVCYDTLLCFGLANAR